MTMARTFQQFFTPKKYSQIMINSLEIDPPKKVVDLAMGEGSLLIEAIQRWGNSSYYGNDIDPNCCKQISKDYSDIYCYHYDIFSSFSINSLIDRIGKVDLCIGNPPFHLIKQDKAIRQILKQFKLDKMYKSEFIPSEVPFILQSFKILEENGTLALILPDGFFTNIFLSNFRQFLLENYEIQRIIELPAKVFKKTDAKTHILILKNTKCTKKQITLYSIGHPNKLTVTHAQAVKRMDYSHYYNLKILKHYKTLFELNVQLIRGKSKCLIQDIDQKYILHTTNFSKSTIFKNRLKTKKSLVSYKNQIAMPGDIIFARVGTNSVGKIGIVTQGYFIATDCIFIIRTSDEILRAKIHNSLLSDIGQKWIRAHLKGVAAKHITLEDINHFPIMNDDNE